jgi:hypothetical protein
VAVGDGLLFVRKTHSILFERRWNFGSRLIPWWCWDTQVYKLSAVDFIPSLAILCRRLCDWFDTFLPDSLPSVFLEYSLGASHLNSPASPSLWALHQVCILAFMEDSRALRKLPLHEEDFKLGCVTNLVLKGAFLLRISKYSRLLSCTQPIQRLLPSFTHRKKLLPIPLIIFLSR